MGCSCQNGKNADGTPKTRTFTVTTGSGDKKSYSSEVEAAAAARRSGGSYKPVPA
jgi:hypothetical protein